MVSISHRTMRVKLHLQRSPSVLTPQLLLDAMGTTRSAGHSHPEEKCTNWYMQHGMNCRGRTHLHTLLLLLASGASRLPQRTNALR